MRNEAFFDMVLAQYKAKSAEAKALGQPDPGIPILTYSSLRLEQFIIAGTTTYTFGVLQNDIQAPSGTVLPTEIRLQTNDNFHISDVGFYTALAASTATAFILNSYPNEVEYTAATRTDMLNIYNGKMNINVNQVDVLTNYRLSKHYYVPQTQRLSAAANSNRDQLNLETDALIPLKPAIMLSGAYTNTITINIPGAVTNATPSNGSRMVIIFDGLRAQNAAIRK